MKLKKSNLFLSLLTLSSVSFLSSCKKNFVSTSYSVNMADTQNKIFISKVTTTLNKGQIVSSEYEEVYTPSYWATVKDEDKNKLDTLEVTVNNQTINYAKYLKIGSLTWIGELRDASDKKYAYGEYVRYALPNSSADKQNEYDLINYITPRTASADLGTTAKAYYDAVINDDIKLLKSEGENNFVDSMVLPTFSNGKIVKEDSKYTSYYEAIDNIDKYLVGKKLNFKSSNGGYYTVKSISGTWHYNPTLAYAGEEDDIESIADNDELWEKIEGASSSVLSRNTVISVFSNINKNFVTLEYDSIR